MTLISHSCLKTLKAGAILVVWKLDRLGRSLRARIGLLDDLEAAGHSLAVADGGHGHGNPDRPCHGGRRSGGC